MKYFRLENLKKKNGSPQLPSSELMRLKLEAALPPSSPILKLSDNERQNLLAWLDLQRNSEVNY